MFCQETCADGRQTSSEYMEFGILLHKKRCTKRAAQKALHKKTPESFLSGADNG
jgi:hypothetical protein